MSAAPSRSRLDALAEAAAFAQAHEVAWPRDPHAEPGPSQVRFGVHHDDPAPWNVLRGPVHARGPVSGVVWQHGQELLAWGEPDRADLTFSVAKTFLALLAGVAQARGLLPDVNEPVGARVPGIGFEGPHNGAITWAHLLEQTSEWEGSCFGLPDTVDRYRVVSHDPKPPQGRKGDARPLRRDIDTIIAQAAADLEAKKAEEAQLKLAGATREYTDEELDELLGDLGRRTAKGLPFIPTLRKVIQSLVLQSQVMREKLYSFLFLFFQGLII